MSGVSVVSAYGVGVMSECVGVCECGVRVSGCKHGVWGECGVSVWGGCVRVWGVCVAGVSMVTGCVCTVCSVGVCWCRRV